jgi:hypothetical protein
LAAALVTFSAAAVVDFTTPASIFSHENLSYGINHTNINCLEQIALVLQLASEPVASFSLIHQIYRTSCSTQAYPVIEEYQSHHQTSHKTAKTNPEHHRRLRELCLEGKLCA